MTDMVIMPGSHYQAICDAVRAKTGDTAALRSGELAAAITAASGGQTERGSFVTDSTLSISIPCGFEPDVIVIKRQESVNPDGDLRCLFSLIIIKNILSAGRYISSDGATAATNGGVFHDPEGYANNGVSYTDGAICGKPLINGRNLLSGYAYDYIFGRCGL